MKTKLTARAIQSISEGNVNKYEYIIDQATDAELEFLAENGMKPIPRSLQEKARSLPSGAKRAIEISVYFLPVLSVITALTALAINYEKVPVWMPPAAGATAGVTLCGTMVGSLWASNKVSNFMKDQ